MKILYGVVGEGMGHAIRSRVVLDHLVDAGHEIQIIVSGRAADFLARRFHGVNKISGLHMISEDNTVKRGKTFWANVLSGTVGVPKNIATYFEFIEQFRPELVISDFESWTYYFAKAHRIPIFSIDNMQIINRCTHDGEILARDRANFEIARTFVKGKLPFCDHYFVTTFFYPETRRERTSLYPPILRPEILDAKSEHGSHLLVYQTAEGHGELEESLRKLDMECRVYGMRRGIEEDVAEGNLRFRPFNETVFFDDLRTARAALTGGGFTLMGEAVYLHKPVLSVPLANQFEQTLNARYLERLGYGLCAETITSVDAIRDFLTQLPRFEERLATYHQDGNTLLFAALDEHIDRAAAGIY